MTPTAVTLGLVLALAYFMYLACFPVSGPRKDGHPLSRRICRLSYGYACITLAVALTFLLSLAHRATFIFFPLLFFVVPGLVVISAPLVSQSWILYRRSREARDLPSLLVSSLCSALLAVEAVTFYFVSRHLHFPGPGG